MALDGRIVCQGVAAWRARRERDKLGSEHGIGTECRGYIGRQCWNPIIEADRHPHGVFFVWRRFSLLRSQVAHRDDAPGWGTGITDLGVRLNAGHIFIIDLQSAFRFFQTIA